MLNKFIIFEGPDNVGKDTQIKLILKSLINFPTHIIHYTNIKDLTNKEIYDYNHKLYNDMFSICEKSNNRNLIFNRSHLGEYVYGYLYRKYDTEYIFEIEKSFSKKDFWKKLYLIVLIDTEENLIKRDDGLSHSIDLDKKKCEITRFNELYQKTYIQNKILIKGGNINEINTKINEFLENK